jgi:hypothetical protein
LFGKGARANTTIIVSLLRLPTKDFNVRGKH